MAEAFIRPAATSGAIITSFDEETFEILQELKMDITTGEDYTTSVEWTQHPREEGADATDNASLQLDRVSLRGVMTQTPIIGGDTSTDRLDAAQETLSRLVKDRIPLLVTTGLRVLEDYVATNLVITRSQATGQSFEFSIDLQELITVEAQFTEVEPAPVRADKAGAAAPATDGGTKAPTETTPEAEAGQGAAAPATDADGEVAPEEDQPSKSIAAKSFDLAQSSFGD